MTLVFYKIWEWLKKYWKWIIFPVGLLGLLAAALSRGIVDNILPPDLTDAHDDFVGKVEEANKERDQKLEELKEQHEERLQELAEDQKEELEELKEKPLKEVVQWFDNL